MKKAPWAIVAALLLLLLGVTGMWRGWIPEPDTWGPAKATPSGAEPGVAADRAESAAKSKGKKIKYWVAPMDPAYVRNQPGKSPMGMDLVPVYEEKSSSDDPATTIRIDSATIQNMGIRTAKVRKSRLVRNIRAFGSLALDETHRGGPPSLDS